MTRYVWLVAGILCFSLGWIASPHAIVAAAQESGSPMILPSHPESLVVETREGEQQFTIEIAASNSERARGLMHRTEMADDHGMLFVFEDTRNVGFWMKNTPMPLDLIFIGDDGRVRAILPGDPFSLTPISPNDPVRFVLEVKAGTAQKAGIAAGDRIRHPVIEDIVGRD